MSTPHSLIFLRSRKRGAVLAGMTGAALALAAGTFAMAAQAQSADAPVKLLLRWYDTMPDDSLHNTRVQVAFHNGQFDVFDLGKSLPAVLAEWAGRNFTPVPEFHEAFLAAWPDAKISQIWNPKQPLAATIPSPGFNRPVPWQTVVTVNPAQHRFLSFFSLLHPANDAMVANEDPYQIELFNSQGKFRGPLLLNIRGNQVLDLGLCENNEAQLANLDVAEFSGQACTAEDGTVTWHPGLNGSHRNPDGQPQRVLGGSTSYVPSGSTGHSFYDPVDADFSRPGYRIGQLQISRWVAPVSLTGSWYSPERAGEGFNIELVEPAADSQNPRILVYWYTFTPDGSGEQVWLAGMADMDDEEAFADVEMYLTTGGEFASNDNPALVTRERWGSLRVAVNNCQTGQVTWQADDPDWPDGNYAIHRLSPPLEGLGWTCDSREQRRLVLPEE